MVEKERMSNFELLRIFSILLIISFHYVYKGNFVFEALTVNKMIVNYFTMFGEIGVNLFILISGYFMIHSNKIKTKKIVLLLIEVLFYNLLSLLIVSHFEWRIFISMLSFKDFFPTIYGTYWFTTAYILLIIISPYINRLIKNLSFKEFSHLVLILICLYSIIPTLFGIRLNNTESLLYYNRFIWIIIIYMIGAYISLYREKISIFSKGRGFYIVTTILISLLALFIIYIIEIFPSFFNQLGIHSSTYLWRPNSILILLWSLSLFLLFMGIRIQSRIINTLASTTLGIYLLHDGKIQHVLWNNIFKNSTHTYSRFLIIHILIAVSIIFIVGCFIDLIRQYLANKIVLFFDDSKRFIKKRLS